MKRGLSGSGGDSARTAERIGADGTRVYVCSVCLRIEIAGYDGWTYHLGMREHQENLKKAKSALAWRKNFESRKRCLVIKGIEGKTSSEVLEYLKIWGQIEDFQYDFVRAENGKARHCICLYRDEESALACLNDGAEWEGRKLTIHVQTREPRIPSDLRSRKRKYDDGYDIYSGR